MRQTTNGEKIEYLLRIKFPGGLHPQPLRSSGNSGGPSDAEMRRIQAERERLSALPGIELSRLCAIELDAKCEREEKALFFNQPAANADFGYWSTVEYWTLDETIALLLGKNPEVVKWQTVEPYLGHADLARYERQCLGIGTSAANAEPGFAKQYALLRRRAMRADVLNPVNARVDPVGAVEWARQTGGISIPAPLEAGLAGRRPRPAQAMATAPERASAITLEPQAAPVVAVGAFGGVETGKTGPLAVEHGLSTKDIANAFNDVKGWNSERWRKSLSASQWLHPARIAIGGAGGASAVWNPVMLAQLMHDEAKGEREKEKLMKVLNSRFTRYPALGPWRDAFDEYFATHCATD